MAELVDNAAAAAAAPAAAPAAAKKAKKNAAEGPRFGRVKANLKVRAPFSVLTEEQLV